MFSQTLTLQRFSNYLIAMPLITTVQEKIECNIFCIYLFALLAL